MKSLRRRHVLVGALGWGALLGEMTVAPSARADFFGGDLPLLAGILVQSIQQAASLLTMVSQTINEVKMMTTMLQAVGSGSFPALITFINAARSSYDSLTWGVRSMTYRMAQIDSDYQKLFPGDAPPAGSTVAQHAQQYRAWHQEVVASAQIASRQQSNLATLDDHAAKTQAILDESRSADGIVAQLQLVAQMIGITNAQLILINQTLSTTGRVLTDMAAAGASERQLSLSKQDDSRAGYTDKGAPVVVPHTLP
jgi:hypothetical protein